jgi:hypothetical protein
MRYCFDHRVEAALLGAKGRDEVTEKLSLKAAGERMAAQLADVAAFAAAEIPRTPPATEQALPALKVLAR